MAHDHPWPQFAKVASGEERFRTVRRWPIQPTACSFLRNPLDALCVISNRPACELDVLELLAVIFIFPRLCFFFIDYYTLSASERFAT
jgi:hypothetical protein